MSEDNSGLPVRVTYVSLGTTEGLDTEEFQPPEGWFVDEVLCAAASNGLGVIMVMRPYE